MAYNKSLNFKRIIICLSFLFALCSPIVDWYYDTYSIFTTLAIFIFGIILWISNIIPAALTGIVIIVLFSVSNVLTFEESAMGLGNPVVWLVISVLILSLAIRKYQFDLRIAYSLLILSKGNKKLVLLILIMISFVLIFLVPNAVARLTILLSITEGILEGNNEGKNSNFTKASMLIVTYAPYMGTVAIFTGATGSIYAIGLFSEMLQYEWSYLYWMLLMVPGSILSLLTLWGLLLFLYPIKNNKLETSQTYFYQEKRKIGKITTKSYKLIIIYILLILLWMTTSLHPLSIPLVSVIIMTILFIPGIELLDWKQTIQEIDWGIPILFAAGLTIAKAFQKSGILEVVSSITTDFATEKPLPLVVCSIIVILILIRLFFTNFNATVATLLPIILIIAQNIGINPIWFGMLALSVMSMAYILPTQSIGNMIMISKQYYSPIDLLRTGIPLTMLMICIFLGLAYIYWPMVGLSY